MDNRFAVAHISHSPDGSFFFLLFRNVAEEVKLSGRSGGRPSGDPAPGAERRSRSPDAGAGRRSRTPEQEPAVRPLRKTHLPRGCDHTLDVPDSQHSSGLPWACHGIAWFLFLALSSCGDPGGGAPGTTGVIEGSVQLSGAPEGTDLSGVMVVVDQTDDVAFTAPSGRFRLAGLAPGEVTLTASRAGLGSHRPDSGRGPPEIVCFAAR